MTRQALTEVREAVQGYRRLALPDALEGARAALGAAGIDCRIKGAAAEVPADVENLLAWAVREAATNVVRHSDARVCAITIATDRAGVVLQVEDDGRASARTPARARVWRGSRSARAAALLAAAGHRLDAAPDRDGPRPRGPDEPRRDGLDWDAHAAVEDVTRINDLAYGFEVGTFGGAMTRGPPGPPDAPLPGPRRRRAGLRHGHRRRRRRLRHLPGGDAQGAPGPRPRPRPPPRRPRRGPRAGAARPRASSPRSSATRCTRGSGTSRSARWRCGSAASDRGPE